MSWEGTMLTGQQAIMEKFNSLPPVRHMHSTLDIQPSTSQNAMIIFVTGKIQVTSMMCKYITRIRVLKCFFFLNYAD
jgi:hypothetical protein